jgi:hypothetical protein
MLKPTKKDHTDHSLTKKFSFKRFFKIWKSESMREDIEKVTFKR